MFRFIRNKLWVEEPMWDVKCWWSFSSFNNQFRWRSYLVSARKFGLYGWILSKHECQYCYGILCIYCWWQLRNSILHWFYFYNALSFTGCWLHRWYAGMSHQWWIWMCAHLFKDNTWKIISPNKNAAKVILYNLIPKTKFSICKKSVWDDYLIEGLSLVLIIQKPPWFEI